MGYKDQLTKSVLVQSLEGKRFKDITYYQLDIFTTFGVLNILHSKNSEEFCKFYQRQSQDWVECAIWGVKNEFPKWTKSDKATKWREGLQCMHALEKISCNEKKKKHS